mmetsp:Transcript_146299/g.407539  ORF Transcript_146299/g.407539 Transcript_146299/m.407539 type:complete len:364 (-) Transcript_146299:817-1908(-)
MQLRESMAAAYGFSAGRPRRRVDGLRCDRLRVRGGCGQQQEGGIPCSGRRVQEVHVHQLCGEAASPARVPREGCGPRREPVLGERPGSGLQAAQLGLVQLHAPLGEHAPRDRPRPRRDARAPAPRRNRQVPRPGTQPEDALAEHPWRVKAAVRAGLHHVRRLGQRRPRRPRSRPRTIRLQQHHALRRQCGERVRHNTRRHGAPGRPAYQPGSPRHSTIQRHLPVPCQDGPQARQRRRAEGRQEQPVLRRHGRGHQVRPGRRQRVGEVHSRGCWSRTDRLERRQGQRVLRGRGQRRGVQPKGDPPIGELCCRKCWPRKDRLDRRQGQQVLRRHRPRPRLQQERHRGGREAHARGADLCVLHEGL